jgi:hypothetical protein
VTNHSKTDLRRGRIHAGQPGPAELATDSAEQNFLFCGEEPPPVPNSAAGQNPAHAGIINAPHFSPVAATPDR